MKTLWPIFQMVHHSITETLHNFAQPVGLLNPLCAVGEKSQQCRTSSCHGGREKLTEKHQPVSEGISWEPRIIRSHAAPQRIAKSKLSSD